MKECITIALWIVFALSICTIGWQATVLHRQGEIIAEQEKLIAKEHQFVLQAGMMISLMMGDAPEQEAVETMDHTLDEMPKD